jgi:hypothetical protein
MNKTILDPKEIKYIQAKVQGKSKRQAGLAAGAKTPVAADKYANRMSKNVKVQQAIEYALEAEQLTPQYLVAKLKEVIEQDKEIGAKRLAIKDGLELNGWQRGDRPTVVLDVQNAFFNQTRTGQVIDQT